MKSPPVRVCVCVSVRHTWGSATDGSRRLKIFTRWFSSMLNSGKIVPSLISASLVSYIESNEVALSDLGNGWADRRDIFRVDTTRHAELTWGCHVLQLALISELQ